MRQGGLDFDGVTYDPDEDFTRLKTCLEKARYLMTHPRGQWWTLRELAGATQSSEAGISARIRDLRKPRHGGFEVERKRLQGGLWAYRVKPPSTSWGGWSAPWKGEE